MPDNDKGCQWIVGRVKKWDSKAKGYVMQPVYCHKLEATGSTLCPRHQLVAEQKPEQKGERYY